MPTGYVDGLLAVLTEASWEIDIGAPNAVMPGFLDDFLPASEMFGRVRSCVSTSGRVWFFGSEDYLDDSNNGWDFIRREICLPSAIGDEAWKEEIEQFWSLHMPIALSVAGEYEYLAVDRSSSFWIGLAPEFEQPRLLAVGVSEFVSMLERESNLRSGRLWSFLQG